MFRFEVQYAEHLRAYVLWDTILKRIRVGYYSSENAAIMAAKHLNNPIKKTRKRNQGITPIPY